MSRVGKPFGLGYLADPTQLAIDLEWLRKIGETRTTFELVHAMRYFAELYDVETQDKATSDALSLGYELDCGGDTSDRHGELFERTVSELGLLRVVHYASRSISMASRALRMLGSRLGWQFNRHDDSSTHGRPDSARGANVEAGARGGHCPGPHADAPDGGAA